MNRTLLDKGFRVEGRKTWYLTPAETQRDLDRFLAYANLERRHQGYRLQGQTPAQALREALGVETLPPSVPEEQVDQPGGADQPDAARSSSRAEPGVGEILNLNTLLAPIPAALRRPKSRRSPQRALRRSPNTTRPEPTRTSVAGSGTVTTSSTTIVAESKSRPSQST